MFKGSHRRGKREDGYQVTNYGLCGECKHHQRDKKTKAWYCANVRSDNYGDFTEYTESCPDWAKEGIDD